MSEPVIEITVGKNGEIVVDPIGFQGSECDKATAPLYEVLGDISDRENKPEYFSIDPNNRSSAQARIRA
jgi:hypothetical protein